MAGIYIHVPFCERRCTYCDFYFVTTARSHAPFVRAVTAEIAHYGGEYASREPIETIYFGGGTPSRLNAQDVEAILRALNDAFDTSAVREVTFEMNPDDAGLTYLRQLKALGINRLSIGIQSFFEADLTFMNRSHSELQARQVVDTVREAGFENFSIDLIFGVPDQPEEYWAANLERAVTMEVPHISTYSLTVEEGTVLANQVRRGIVQPREDEDTSDQYLFTMEYLESRGMEHYEISSFARPGFRSQHNASYWRHANYLGFGPSAHSFWWKGLPARRWANIRNLRAYEAFVDGGQLPLDYREDLLLDDLADEYIMLALRTREGIDLELLEQRYGVDLLDENLENIAWLEEAGHIEPVSGRRLRLTPQGRTVCDSVVRRLALS
ncbi:MAG: radical SAM family heme chaperone HemW [Rhodothermales bacterium]|nr:radical SAM family heme chaperone HemW [Rhodothermales bacterium]MBO6781239.1 radical SAM family heme chaperone HemW [Rhodothermales bacterium]